MRSKMCVRLRATTLISESHAPAIAYSARDASCLTGACVEFVGIVARAVGPSFVTHPQMLPSVLTPVLEKLGDPVREVTLQPCMLAIPL